MSVRYAPSPTGQLHIGNLRTAWVSKTWADHLGMEWVVRFEDIDRPRVLPGMMEKQRSDLESLGLRPDRYYLQSSRIERHWEVFEELVKLGLAYPCVCSRKEIRETIERSSSAPHFPPAIYNGKCRPTSGTTQNFPRTKLPSIGWRFLNTQGAGLEDFLIARTRTALLDRESFTPTYTLACAIDDFDGGYQLLVRAWDLFESTSSQRTLQRWLASRSSPLPLTEIIFPGVFHTSLVTQNTGKRLEKRTHGITLDELIQCGLSPDKIKAIFKKSFMPRRDEFVAAKVFGEDEKMRTLLSLGI